MIAPDDTTYAYLRDRRFAPTSRRLRRRGGGVAETCRATRGAVFDREEVIDASIVAPTVTWGTSPEHAIGVDGLVPDPTRRPIRPSARPRRRRCEYMDLRPGQPIAGTKIDWVFIGSCTNGRLSDLRQAAAVLGGRRVAPGVTAWVVPGSERVKRDAEAEGLDRLFRDAGFAWREPGCSMCVAANGERVPPGARSVSTSNRNFVGRQGPGARTHLASPAMAAAAALAGRITDVREI